MKPKLLINHKLFFVGSSMQLSDIAEFENMETLQGKVFQKKIIISQIMILLEWIVNSNRVAMLLIT